MSAVTSAQLQSTWWRRLIHRLAGESAGRRLVIMVPYLWLLLFFLLPFGIVLKVSFAEYRLGIPPFTPLISMVEESFIQLKLNFGTYTFLWEDEIYAAAYINSIRMATISTLLALLIGYPMAYGIARSRQPWRNILLLAVVLPFWTSFLIRVYAWIGILKNNGLLNNFLIWLGVIDDPIMMLNTNFAVYLGIVYSYLPFMILPLYATLEKLDGTLLEASYDLGAGPIKTFLNVTLPLSMPGIVAGSMLVFIPAVGEFVIPTLLGGADTLMIGSVLWGEFFNNRDWPVASAVATGMVLMLLIPIVVWQRYQSKQEAT